MYKVKKPSNIHEFMLKKKYKPDPWTNLPDPQHGSRELGLSWEAQNHHISHEDRGSDPGFWLKTGS